MGDFNRISVFGGTGGTGRAVIRQAVQYGWRVQTLVRNARALREFTAGVDLIHGSLSSDVDVERTIRDSHAVIVVFGPRPPYTEIFCEDATKRIIVAMRKLRVERLICQTGGMVGDYPLNRTLPFKLMVSIVNHQLPQVADDRSRQETLVRQSGLLWTIVKPPRLTESAPRGRWVAGANIRLGVLSSISRADLSAFLLGDALRGAHDRQVVFIKA